MHGGTSKVSLLSFAAEVRTRALANAFNVTREGAWTHLLEDLGQIGANARPVVIQGGLSTDAYLYEPLKRLLESRGFKVFASGMPLHGFASFTADAHALSGTVDEAVKWSLANGGDGLVSLVGHSKGGLTSRLYLQSMGGLQHVAQLVTVGTPHNGTQPIGKLATQLLSHMPGLPGVKQLSSNSKFVTGMNADLPWFMRHAREVQPGFRMTSLAGDLDLPGLRGTDLLVSTGAAALDDSIAGVRNLVFKGGLPHHGAIVGQYGMHEPTLRAVVELLAGHEVDDVARGAGLLARPPG
jgi:triacylglycerol lipase